MSTANLNHEISTPLLTPKEAGKPCFSERLVEEQSMLQRYAYSLTQDLADAQDLVQETTLKALHNRRKFVENVNFRGWLTTIMRNIFINSYMSRIRRWEIFDVNADPSKVFIPAKGSSFAPEDAFSLGEITQAIDRLGETNRIPFQMYLEGYKYNEIAEKLQVPVGTVKSRIHLARKVLQKDLRELEP